MRVSPWGPVSRTMSSASSPRSRPPIDLPALRRDDDGLVAAGEAGVREDDRLEQIALGADLADRRQVRTERPAVIADRVARAACGLRAVEQELAAPRIAVADRAQQLFELAHLRGRVRGQRREQRFAALLNRGRVLRQPRAQHVGPHARCARSRPTMRPPAHTPTSSSLPRSNAGSRCGSSSGPLDLSDAGEAQELRAIERGLLEHRGGRQARRGGRGRRQRARTAARTDRRRRSAARPGRRRAHRAARRWRLPASRATRSSASLSPALASFGGRHARAPRRRPRA